MIGQQHSYNDHIEERSMWERWLDEQLVAFVNEPLAHPNVATYKGREGEFRLCDMETESVGFSGWFSGNDQYIDVPIQYLFDPVQWRSDRMALYAKQEAEKQASLARVQSDAKERRRKQYEALHEEFGEPLRGIEPCTVPGCPGWV